MFVSVPVVKLTLLFVISLKTAEPLHNAQRGLAVHLILCPGAVTIGHILDGLKRLAWVLSDSGDHLSAVSWAETPGVAGAPQEAPGVSFLPLPAAEAPGISWP